MREKQKIKSFTDLIAWQFGHRLVLEIYKATDSFPKEEKLGLTSQMRRAAVSVTSNIAEGFIRKGKKEKNQFYKIAQGSVTELQNQILIARDVGYLGVPDFKNLSAQTISVIKIIYGLITGLDSRY